MKKITFLILAGIITLFSACETIKNLPTNTSGGLFSLNGNWKLVTTTDNNAQVGTVVTVAPGIASAFVKTFENNSYCYRANDEAWKSLISSGMEQGYKIISGYKKCHQKIDGIFL